MKQHATEYADYFEPIVKAARGMKGDSRTEPLGSPNTLSHR